MVSAPFSPRVCACGLPPLAASALLLFVMRGEVMVSGAGGLAKQQPAACPNHSLDVQAVSVK